MTLLRSWTEAWLKYVRWYYATALSPYVSIEDFFQAPVVTTRSFQRIHSQEPMPYCFSGMLRNLTHYLD
ncbi:hypothetical protein RYX36_016857 [Vicia faba]